MANLVLLNGTPGIGKSTLARRYVVDHQLALNVDIDEIRRSLGRWAEHDESAPLASALGVAMARTHLVGGHDVVIPQWGIRTSFIDALRHVAHEAGADFRHIVVVDTLANALVRFRMRRAELIAAGIDHPEADIDPARDIEVIQWAANQLEALTTMSDDIDVLDTTVGDVDGAYRALCRILDEHVDHRPSITRREPPPTGSRAAPIALTPRAASSGG